MPGSSSQRSAPAKKSDEEKAAEKKLKANESMLKACKDDELKKVEEDVPIPEIRAYGAKAKATLVKAIKDGGGKVPPEYE